MKVLLIILIGYMTSIVVGLTIYISDGKLTNFIKKLFSKRHKVFRLCDDMENVDKLYNEILDYYSCRKSRRYDLIYKNDKMNLILNFTNISITEYYQTVLRIYMLQIDGLYLPKDRTGIYTIDDVKDLQKQIDLYGDLSLYIRSCMNETDLIMIKTRKLNTDDISYKVCVGITSALNYIKLLKNLVIIEDNLNNSSDNESSKNIDKDDIKKPQINTLPVLNTFKIIDGDIDDLSEFIDYFTDTDDYKIKSVYTNNKVNYSCNYKSSHIYLDAFLTDIQNIINMRYKKSTYDDSRNKIANVMTVILDGNDNNINIRDIKKMASYIKPEFIITISIESKLITFTDSDEYIIDYLKSRKHENNDNM